MNKLEHLDKVKVVEMHNVITIAMAKLDEDAVISLVKHGLDQGVDPQILLEEARIGMEEVGKLYGCGSYFLADMIIAADIFHSVLDLVLKTKSAEPKSAYPPIIFGTVADDIHDIGKNLTIGVLKSRGFRVIDLGVDVPPNVFAETIKTTGSTIVCLSGLITSAYDSMKATVDMLKVEGLRPDVVVIIGGLVNENIKNYTGADYWFSDCAKVGDLCKGFYGSI